MYIWGKLVPASICRGSACRGYSSHVWGQNEEKTKFLWIFLEQWRRQLCSRYPELRISQQLLRASSTKSVLTHNVLRIFQNILCNPPALFPFSSSLCFFFNWSRVDTVLLCQILQLSPLKFIKFHLCSLPDSKDLCRHCWLVLQLQCCLPAASGHWQSVGMFTALFFYPSAFMENAGSLRPLILNGDLPETGLFMYVSVTYGINWVMEKE